MKRKYKHFINIFYLIIMLLTSVLLINFSLLIFQSVDKSMLINKFTISKAFAMYNPCVEYLYWGNDHSTIKSITNFISPSYKIIYEEAALSSSTIPSGYLSYYKAIKQSDAAGVASEKVQENVQTVFSDSSSTMKSTYTMNQLSDYSFLVNEFYTVDHTTYIDEELINAENLLNQDMRISKESGAAILIYHTHSQEAFSDSIEGDSKTSIVAVGEYLAQILRQTYGFNVIHNTQVYDMVDGKLDRNKAYTYAEAGIKKILTDHPEIEVIIDLHRDGVDGEKLTTNIGGKETAKLMFFNGLSRTVENGEIDALYNPNLSGNLAMSFKAQLIANCKYPGLMRHIYLKGYQYNLHFKPRSMLIEAGSQKNTFQEMLNAMEPLADILNDVLTKEIIIE